ncbi:MAG: MBG domain-containing protein, partial [Clostridia bacterium]|nr:MBG domain-containing protein [Clostridia bacterium]
DYILKVYVSNVESYDGFNCGFAFTVEEAEFDFDDSELNENTFTYAYNGQMNLYKNVELPEDALLVSADDREGVWKNLSQYYGEAYLTYNLLRWNTGNYVTKAEMEQLSHPKEKPVAVDTYKVYYKLCAPNFKQTEAGKYFTVVIDKAGIKIPAKFERTYNGSEISYEVESGALYSLVGTAVYINAGEYDVTLKLNDSNNYAWINSDGQLTASATTTAKFVIAKADFNVDSVTFDGISVPYDGETHSLSVEGLPEELEVTYENNGQVNANTYTVTAKFTFKDAEFGKNYKDVTPMTAELVITKIDYVIEGDPIIFDDGSAPYDGKPHSLAVDNLPDVLEVTYENNGQMSADTYTVTAKFTFKDPVMAGNYNEIPSMSATLTITPVDYDLTKVTFADQSLRYTGSPLSISIADLPEELEATYENNGQTIVGEYTVIAKFTLKGVAAQNYNPITETLSAKLTILKAQIKIPAAQTTYHKDGQSHTYQVAADAPYAVENGEEYNALGEYEVTLKLKDTHNYEWVDDEGNVINSATVSAKFIVAERPQLPLWVWIAAGGGVLAIIVLIVVIVVVKKKKNKAANVNTAKKK